jgi:hypothetical protein
MERIKNKNNTLLLIHNSGMIITLSLTPQMSDTKTVDNIGHSMLSILKMLTSGVHAYSERARTHARTHTCRVMSYHKQTL